MSELVKELREREQYFKDTNSIEEAEFFFRAAARIEELERRLAKHAAVCTKCGYYVDAQDANKEAKTRIEELEGQFDALGDAKTTCEQQAEQILELQGKLKACEEAMPRIAALEAAIEKHKKTIWNNDMALCRDSGSVDFELCAALEEGK